VHILPHWNWPPEFAGKEIPVWTYTNAESVELFLNDKSLGTRDWNGVKETHLTWSVPYAPGTLRAVGKKGGKIVAEDRVETTTAPARLELVVDRPAIRADGQDLAFVTVRITDAFFQKYMGTASPRIAVAALNPHAGEGGMFGDEETTLIAPAISACRAAGIAASGPYPPDTIFHRAYRGEFDVVVAMTHDHGLIPLKLVHFDDGVNVTMGLPIIRTSVDHGTAYDIAGKGTANPASLLAAVRMAASMAAKAG